MNSKFPFDLESVIIHFMESGDTEPGTSFKKNNKVFSDMKDANKFLRLVIYPQSRVGMFQPHALVKIKNIDEIFNVQLIIPSPHHMSQGQFYIENVFWETLVTSLSERSDEFLDLFFSFELEVKSNLKPEEFVDMKIKYILNSKKPWRFKK